MSALLATAPIQPDFHFCNEFYSDYRDSFGLTDCLQAEALMPRGTQPLRYHEPAPPVHDAPDHDLEFPVIYRHGQCEIAIEVIDPSDPDRPNADAWFDIPPDTFRGMAGWVIRQCVQAVPSVGGFVTKNISEAINFLQGPRGSLRYGDWPLNASFFTVAVQGGTEGADLLHPGHYDPIVGGAVFSELHETLLNMPFESPLWNRVNTIAEYINAYWGLMRRGRGRPWHGSHSLGLSSTPSKDTTTYKCDAKLGKPQHVDCSQLQYSQLDHLNDGLPLQPGLTKFLHSETCNIGVSVSRSTTITWRQIKSAIDELIETCVNNPLTSSIGGRAFNGHQPNGIAGKRRRKRDEDSPNALPPGVNITLFQQFEIFGTLPTDSEELESCTWQKALQDQNVRACQSVHHPPHLRV